MDLTEYDYIVISTSGGKDSQVMLGEVVRLARQQGITGRLRAVHADLGRVEWEGTGALAERQCNMWDVPFLSLEFVRSTVADTSRPIRIAGHSRRFRTPTPGIGLRIAWGSTRTGRVWAACKFWGYRTVC